MRIVYRRRRPQDDSRERRFERLLELYHRLLLMADGDAAQALETLRRIGDRHGFFDEALTLQAFVAELERRGLVTKDRGGALRLAPAGEIALRRDALERMFRGLARGAPGEHRARGAGPGRERLSETRPFAFGDPVQDVDYGSSYRNAARRGPDLELRESDLEVFETEASTACATVIAIDVSHSMTLYGEDRITPAKQVALALVELIRTRYPRDSLDVVLFGDQAVLVPPERIPYVSNGPYHTNTRAGLELAERVLLRRRQPNRQVFLITDGKPSALTRADGSVYKNPFGLDEEIVNKTIEAGARLRRRGVVVTTFMLTDDPWLVSFVEDFTRVNRGRAYFSDARRLGSFVLVDYLRNRRTRV